MLKESQNTLLDHSPSLLLSSLTTGFLKKCVWLPLCQFCDANSDTSTSLWMNPLSQLTSINLETAVNVEIVLVKISYPYNSVPYVQLQFSVELD